MQLAEVTKKALVIVMLSKASVAQAFVSEIWNYVKTYQLGVDYASAKDDLELSYETDRGIVSKKCQPVEARPTRQRCVMAMQAGASSGFGVVLQQAFRKKGLFYWDFDVGFAARYLQGKLATSDSAADGLPLRDVKFSLAALVAKPYLVIGITPDQWPDILLSLGPALQLAGGPVSINEKRKHVFLGTGSGVSESGLLRGFTQIEIVFLRFGDGALSLFTARDFTGGVGTEFYPGDVDGMDQFRANFVRGVGGAAFGLGAKFILNWP